MPTPYKHWPPCSRTGRKENNAMAGCKCKRCVHLRKGVRESRRRNRAKPQTSEALERQRLWAKRHRQKEREKNHLTSP